MTKVEKFARIVPQEVRVREIFDQTNAIVSGHFRFRSELHGDEYVNKGAFVPYTKLTSELCRYMAREFQALNIQTVAGPVMGGGILSQRVAEHLSVFDSREIVGIFADETEDKKGFKFRRDFPRFVTGQNVLITDDTLNTGATMKKMVDTVRAIGGNVVAIGVLVNRGGVTSKDVGGVPIKSLLTLKMNKWDPSECPLCKQGIPLNTNLGHPPKKT